MAAEKKPRKPLKDPKREKYRGTVFIDRDRCKGCGFCVEFCPFGALEIEEAWNAKGYHPPYLAFESQCSGCDLCGLYCPDFAIFAVRFANPEYEGGRPAKKAEPAKKPEKEMQK